MDELFQLIRKTISKIAECSLEKIKEDSLLQEELELDSLEIVEILHKIEKKYKIKIEDIELPTFKTVSDLYNFSKNFIKR